MKKITALDIEASGLAPDSYPIEIGVVLPDGNSWCSLITPSNNWQHWCEEAQNIHHISRDNLLKKGKSIRDIAKHLNTLLKDHIVYSDCWVLDDKWIRKLYAEAGMWPSFQLRDIIYLIKEEQFSHWENVKRQAAKRLNLQRHRATNDARILQQALIDINEPPDSTQTRFHTGQ